MDSSLYKDFSTSRGLNYHYYFSSPQDTKSTLLFLHGFPSTSYDWYNQVNFFQKEGYGLIVPDLLGYGGTAKPIDVEAYKDSLITKDLIDILDAEQLDKVIVIAHDWGCKIASRLANRYPERFAAYAFITVHYLPPNPGFDLDETLKSSKEKFGFEIIGYWKFFSEDGADQIIEQNWERFHNIVFTDEPRNWRTMLAPTGALESTLLGTEEIRSAPWLKDKDKEIQKAVLLKGGIKAPLNWYKVVTSKIAAEDEKSIPKDRYSVDKPVFYAVPTRDVLAVPPMGKHITGQYCKSATIKEFDTGHWLMMEKPDELNREILVWLKGIYT